jgi:hypothetical protein
MSCLPNICGSGGEFSRHNGNNLIGKFDGQVSHAILERDLPCTAATVLGQYCTGVASNPTRNDRLRLHDKVDGDCLAVRVLKKDSHRHAVQFYIAAA